MRCLQKVVNWNLNIASIQKKIVVRVSLNSMSWENLLRDNHHERYG